MQYTLIFRGANGNLSQWTVSAASKEQATQKGRHLEKAFDIPARLMDVILQKETPTTLILQ